MTPREKIFRDALEKAQTALDDTRDYHTHESRETLLLSEIEKINRALKQADAIKIDPSMDELLWNAKLRGRKEMLEQFERKDSRGADEIQDGPSEGDKVQIAHMERLWAAGKKFDHETAQWAIWKLKQYMGIE